MSYFIDNIKTYANVNKKGRALQIYVQQFDRHLIADECSLDALKCDIEHQIKIMNEKYPRSRPVRLDVFDDGKDGQWTILVEHDSDSIVCIISYEKVLGYYALANKIDEFSKIGYDDEQYGYCFMDIANCDGSSLDTMCLGNAESIRLLPNSLSL